jgi:hypothetical protein
MDDDGLCPKATVAATMVRILTAIAILVFTLDLPVV